MTAKKRIKSQCHRVLHSTSLTPLRAGGIAAVVSVAVLIFATIPGSALGQNTPPLAGNYQAGAALDFTSTAHGAMLTGLDNFSTSALTVSLWINSAAANSEDGIVSYAASTVSVNDFLIYDQSSLTVYIGGVSTDTALIINDGQWHHLAITWRGTDGALTVYLDGAIAAAGTLRPGYVIGAGGALVLGQHQDSFGGGFDPAQAYIGQLDEVRIWNKAQSQADIVADMNRPIVAHRDGLVGCWTLDEAGGARAVDSSRNHYDLDLINGLGFVSPSGAMGGFLQGLSLATNEDTDTTAVLDGHDPDPGTALTAVVVSLPASDVGALYQLAVGGGRGARIETAPTTVTDALRRVIFAPANRAVDKTASFDWKVYDGVALSTNTATCAIDIDCHEDGTEAHLYVDRNAPGPVHDGQSWATAFKTIQQAGTSATLDIDAIWVADGTYCELVTLKTGVRLFGGFEGYAGAEERNLYQRDWRLNATTVDGENDRRCFVAGGIDNTRIDGFNVTRGLSPWTGVVDSSGGGCVQYIGGGAGHVLTNCVISDGVSAGRGGGVFTWGSGVTVSRCRITDNLGAWAHGGGVAFHWGQSRLEDCVLSGNSATLGAGLWVSGGGHQVTNCLFYGNTGERGAAICVSDAAITVTNCGISGNTGAWSAGVLLFSGSMDVTNTVFAFSNGYAVSQFYAGYKPTLRNCLFYGNTGGDYRDETGGRTLTGATALNAEPNISGALSGDPKFVNRATGDYRLLSGSPALDQALPGPAPDHDLDAAPRPVDLAGIGQDGTLQGYDIGPYELQTGPRLSVSPSSVAFGQAHWRDAYTTNVVVLASVGTTAVHLSTITILGSSAFSVAPGADLSDMAPGTTRSVELIFDPPLPGIHNGLLAVAYDSTTSLAATVSLQGQGTNTAPLATAGAGNAIRCAALNDRALINMSDFPTGDFTVELWARTAATTRGWLFSYATPSYAGWEVHLGDTSWIGLTMGIHGGSLGITINDGSWHHVAMTWRQSDGNLVFYLDGTQRYQDKVQAGHVIPAAGLLALGEGQLNGYWSFEPLFHYTGDLAQLSVWDHARSAAQIKSDMLRPMYPGAAGLCGYWPFEEGVGVQSADVTSNGQTANLTSDSQWLIGAGPIEARTARVTTTEDQDTTLTLSGYDLDGDPVTLWITALPTYGALYQFAGPGPAGPTRGALIDTTGTLVTDPQGRVVYAPANKATSYTATCEWDANDGAGLSGFPASYMVTAMGDNDPPSVASISRLVPAAPFACASQVIFQVAFADDGGGVSGVTTDSFSIQATEDQLGAAIASVTDGGDGTTWAVTLNTIAGVGNLRVVLDRNLSLIVDSGGLPLQSAFTASDWYTIDRILPQSHVVSPASGTWFTTATFPVQWTASDQGSGLRDVSLFIGDGITTVAVAGSPFDASTTGALCVAPGPGVYGLFTRARDVAGNEETTPTLGADVVVVLAGPSFVLSIANHLTGIAPLTGANLMAADVNHDGVVDVGDIIALLQLGAAASPKAGTARSWKR